MNVITTVPAEVDFARSLFLVLEPKPLFRDLAHAALMRCRVREVKHAPNVEEGIAVLKHFGAQIGGVICDWDMSPVGGLELLRHIRARDSAKILPSTCVVLLTGRVDAGAFRSAMALDVNGVAIAPLSTEKLIKTIVKAANRPWTLQTREHYLAVPAVMPPAN